MALALWDSARILWDPLRSRLGWGENRVSIWPKHLSVSDMVDPEHCHCQSLHLKLQEFLQMQWVYIYERGESPHFHELKDWLYLHTQHGGLRAQWARTTLAYRQTCCSKGSQILLQPPQNDCNAVFLLAWGIQSSQNHFTLEQTHFPHLGINSFLH